MQDKYLFFIVLNVLSIGFELGDLLLVWRTFVLVSDSIPYVLLSMKVSWIRLFG